MMPLLRGAGKRGPKLDRQQAMAAVPVLNQLVTIEHNDRGHALLNLPRRRTSMVRLISKAFRLPPYKRLELDELGTYAVELCDGSNTVSGIIARFAKRFRLNQREAEVSMVSYLQTLAKRGVISLVIPKTAVE
jgi:hypothetical protein